MIEQPFLINDLYLVNPLLGLVKQGNQPKESRLEPRLMHLLCVLVEHNRQLVTRELLTKEVWDNYGNADEGLTQAVSYLRKIFNDNDKTLIETVPKKGYVLNAVIQTTVHHERKETVIPKAKIQQVYLITAILIVILVVSGYFIFKPAKNNRQPADVIENTRQNNPGDGKTPSTNPDKIPDTAKNPNASPDVKK
ncbi:winged helix-turn-helix domain-containing protein [Mucilaginibacter flavidus]|uniref:winged helix-turn-helix domain-containing protein n=1 Tax=Mucilaginibacter flavidus TaxID=2949309 RepID=UPI00209232F0|nr:winged helix-turn-helix domain-containing protein [Mucilaginibacter flavidus]MCO5947761.1 winged helix-turn-helix domain-containing protein [Mucilaginibacter flavidus]